MQLYLRLGLQEKARPVEYTVIMVSFIWISAGVETVLVTTKCAVSAFPDRVVAPKANENSPFHLLMRSTGLFLGYLLLLERVSVPVCVCI